MLLEYSFRINFHQNRISILIQYFKNIFGWLGLMIPYRTWISIVVLLIIGVTISGTPVVETFKLICRSEMALEEAMLVTCDQIMVYEELN